MSSTKECFDRLAAVGVRVEGLSCGKFIDPRDREREGFYSLPLYCPVPEDHTAAFLCNAVLERHPHWNCYPSKLNAGTFYVCEGRTGEILIEYAPTRLAALTLAAERVAKENGNG